MNHTQYQLSKSGMSIFYGDFDTLNQEVMDWVSKKVRDFGLERLSVLEVGSRDINGTARRAFKGPYIGIDFIEGPDVDMVMDAHYLAFLDATFDVVVCTEMIEHDSAFWITLAEIGRVLKSNGHLLLTTRGNGFGEHDWPSDYWRFMPSSGELIANLASCRLDSYEEDPTYPGIFIHGIRNDR